MRDSAGARTTFSRPGRREPYPLARGSGLRPIAPRSVIVGNAAQTLHPIGAQGFNLGLRDALTLADLLVERRTVAAAILAPRPCSLDYANVARRSAKAPLR